MFRITGKKGFHVSFDNGYTVSVQFGPGNYCDNYSREIGRDEEACGKDGSSTAECAVWNASGVMLKQRGWNDTVRGHMNAEQVLKLLAWAAKQKPTA